MSPTRGGTEVVELGAATREHDAALSLSQPLYLPREGILGLTGQGLDLPAARAVRVNACGFQLHSCSLGDVTPLMGRSKPLWRALSQGRTPQADLGVQNPEIKRVVLSGSSNWVSEGVSRIEPVSSTSSLPSDFD